MKEEGREYAGKLIGSCSASDRNSKVVELLCCCHTVEEKMGVCQDWGKIEQEELAVCEYL